jgi:tRNA 2-thiouridine synthesizing protein E
MTTKLIAGKQLEVDGQGYLLHSQDWDEGIARAIAGEEGLPNLSDDHWRVIRFMRRVYAERGDGPSIRQLTKESGVDIKRLYKLFPQGPAKKAAKIAGIPKPHGCV